MTPDAPSKLVSFRATRHPAPHKGHSRPIGLNCHGTSAAEWVLVRDRQMIACLPADDSLPSPDCEAQVSFASSKAVGSVAPEILESLWRQFGIPHRVLDVLVTKVDLQGAGVMAFVGKGVAAGVPEHVRVRLEPQLGFGACALDHSGEACGREWCSPFRGEYK
jgi:hypothetical protein